MKMDWKKMGFQSEEQYIKFLDEKMAKFFKLLEKPEIKAVFKRLKDR